jgi:CRP/FNR family transcriptional regulator, cyclic AMP receptor protein
MSEQRPPRTKARGPRRFDPVVFLESSARGRSLLTHRKKGIIFSQGDVADAVFYIKKGKVKVTVVSKQGKEAVVAILGVDEPECDPSNAPRQPQLVGLPRQLGPV